MSSTGSDPGRHLWMGLRHLHRHALFPSGACRGPCRPIRLQTGPDRRLCDPHGRLLPARRVHRFQDHLRRPRSHRRRRFDHQTDHLGLGDPNNRGGQHPSGRLRSLLHDDQRGWAHRPGRGGPGAQPLRVQLRLLGLGRRLRADVGPGDLRVPRTGAGRRASSPARPSATSSAKSSWCSPTGDLYSAGDFLRLLGDDQRPLRFHAALRGDLHRSLSRRGRDRQGSSRSPKSRATGSTPKS